MKKPNLVELIPLGGGETVEMSIFPKSITSGAEVKRSEVGWLPWNLEFRRKKIGDFEGGKR